MITVASLAAFAPHADPAFAPLLEAAAAAHAIDTPLRVAHWMAQMAEETGYFRVFVEDLNYTSAARIALVWPTRFTEATAAQYVGQPEKLANVVYGNRMGNGPPASGDGWRYRGRGALMITGRNEYDLAETHTGLPLLDQPDLLAEPPHAFTAAGAFWVLGGCNSLADGDHLTAITRVVNGGLTNLALRLAALNRAKSIWR